MKQVILGIAILVLLAGCATVGRMNQLSLGMTKPEVISIMGNPESTSAQGKCEYLTYNLSHGLDPNVMVEVCGNYFVRLVDGKVEAYGQVGDFDSSRGQAQTVNLNIRK